MNILEKIPLTSLKVFEVAGRTCSFTAAACELELTASAVSHSVRKMEKMLDIRLFHRNTREMSLTRDGEVLLRCIQKGFQEIEGGFKSLSLRKNRPLRIHTAPSFANQWLLPRLSSFIKAFPEVELKFSADTDPVRFEDDEFDVDIIYGENTKPGCHQIPLSVEQLTPLCSPQIAQRIKKPEDLYECLLIQCGIQLYQWRGWFEENNLVPPERYGLSFDRSFMAIKAASDGLGVVLESMLLAEQELKNGILVCPLMKTTKEIHYIGHYLCYPKFKQHSHLQVFQDWILNELNIAHHR